MPRKIKRFSTCAYCFKSIPTVYLAHHENVCKVRRGIDPKPEQPLDNAPTKKTKTRTKESGPELLDRLFKEKHKNEEKEND